MRPDNDKDHSGWWNASFHIAATMLAKCPGYAVDLLHSELTNIRSYDHYW